MGKAETASRNKNVSGAADSGESRVGGTRAFLSRTPATMNPGARLVTLTYHSGEDRIVKEAFKEGERLGTLKILTKHVIRPTEEEERANPRSRSAKLRCAERV